VELVACSDAIDAMLDLAVAVHAGASGNVFTANQRRAEHRQAMTEEPSLTPDQEAAVRRLVAQATTQVGRAPDYRLGRAVLRWVTGSRFGQHRAWSSTPRLGTPWEDTACVERADWRTRAAYLDDTDEPVFEIDYRVCRRCRLGWVELPFTLPAYQRRGLATAALAALRTEHPSVSWHTLGGHERDAVPFWTAAGQGVPGGYRQRDRCPHVTVG
jgi:GNAT superfamily N-acetyltransferase